MVVVRCTHNGSYRLSELDGTVSKLRFAAFRLVPYHACSRTHIPITHLVEQEDLVRIHLDEDLQDTTVGPENGESDVDSEV